MGGGTQERWHGIGSLLFFGLELPFYCFVRNAC